MRKSYLPWLRYDVDTPDHPKTMRLIATTGHQHAGWYHLNLLCWAAKHAPEGEVSASSTAELVGLIEEACRWRGARGKLYRALVEVGFVDLPERRPRRAIIHNWEAYQGGLKRAAERSAERVRQHRARQNSSEGRRKPAESKKTQTAEMTGQNGRETVTKRPCNGLVTLETLTVTTEAGAHLQVVPDPQPEAVAAVEESEPPFFQPPPPPLRDGRAASHEGQPHVDDCGLEIRACDLAAELLQRLRERIHVKAAGRVLPPPICYATGLRPDCLELGVHGEWDLNAAHEHEELLLLEAMQEEGLQLAISIAIAPEPPPQPLPAAWTLAQCVRWLQRHGGLSGAAGDKSLAAFWRSAKRVPPAELMAAARAYRRDDHWKAQEWPLAIFVQPGVWKNRCPSLAAVAAEAAERVSR